MSGSSVTIANGAGHAGTDFPAAADLIIPTGSGLGVAANVQYVKLISGTVADTQPMPGDTSATSNMGLYVVTHTHTKRLTSTITPANATAQTAGNAIGVAAATAVITLANAARWSGGTGIITGISLVDGNAAMGATDIVFFRATVTQNGAVAIAPTAANMTTDGTNGSYIATVSTGGFRNYTNTTVAEVMGLAIPYDCAATSLFCVLVSRATWTSAATAKAVVVNVHVTQD